MFTSVGVSTGTQLLTKQRPTLYGFFAIHCTTLKGHDLAMAISAARDSEALLGVFLTTGQTPTMHNAHGIETLWLSDSAVFVSKRGLPPFVGIIPGEPLTVRGHTSIVTSPRRVFGHVLPGGVGENGLAFSVPQGSLVVSVDGQQGILNRRPRSIVIESDEWILTLGDVRGVVDGEVRPKAEADFVRQFARPRVAAFETAPVQTVEVVPNRAVELTERVRTDMASWSDVLRDPDCPPELRELIATNIRAVVVEAHAENTAPERLAELATVFSELRPVIARNPGCYPALRDWIAQVK